MINSNNILLAVNDLNFHRQLIDSMTAFGFNVSVTNPDSISVEIATVKFAPDIVVIESDNTELKALEHLIKNLQLLENPPFIFTLYAYEDELKNQNLLDLGVVNCIEMPYSCAQLCNRIISFIKEAPIDISKLNAEIDLKVTEMLALLGFNSGMHGYGYLREAIFMIAMNSNGRFNFSKVIYPKISEKFDTSTACVERAIRVSIKSAWNNISPSIKDMFFNGNSLKNKTKPTNNEFMLTVGNYIHNEYIDYFNRLDKSSEKKN